jgi:hypothetical protein
MSFFELVKKRYLDNLPTEMVEPKALQKILETNLWPADFIEVDGQKKHIYASDVSITDIFDFFKSRMPWIKIQINNESSLLSKPTELMAVKFVCFHQLAGLLSEVHSEFSKAFQYSLSSELGAPSRETTIH